MDYVHIEDTMEQAKIEYVSCIHAIQAEQGSGKKIALCHGCFDPLHIGHVYHFHEARAYADILVVSITSDKFILKGTGRPLFHQSQRLDMIKELKCVDYALINIFPTAVELINQLRPDFFIKGADYKNSRNKNFAREVNAINGIGGQLVVTEKKWFSSTDIIDQVGFNEFR